MKYYAIHKPYGMLSQFTPEAGHRTISEVFAFPRDVYPVGRLDLDSEGLLLLTNDTALNKLLLDPANKKNKTYAVLTEGLPDGEAIKKLEAGVIINNKGVAYKTRPSKVQVLDLVKFEERVPPVNYTKHHTHTWMQIIISEGKNRQVRKMFAAVGHPVLRLIRTAIEDLTLEDIGQGKFREYSRDACYRLLHI
jgi:23S rRNA pseudouridine2457 synthase